jgi:hypothetical protein
MKGLFPPSSSVTFFKPSAQSFATSLPIRVYNNMSEYVQTLASGRTYRACESDFLDEIVGAQSLAQGRSIIEIGGEDIEYAWLEASFFSQVCQTKHAQWCLWGRFNNHRATSSKSSTAFSENHAIRVLVSMIVDTLRCENLRDRKVPWNKSSSYTDWLFDSNMSSPRLGRLRDCSPDSLRLTCEPPSETCGVINLSSSLSQWFASLVGQYLRKVFLVLSDQGVPFHEQLSTCPGINDSVFQESCLCRLHSFIDIFGCIIWA